MSVDRPTEFADKQQSHLNKIEESKSKNSQESMVSSKSNDSENIKVMNIDSDESEQSSFSENPKDEVKEWVQIQMTVSPQSQMRRLHRKRKEALFYLISAQEFMKRNY